jgi:hypothetical protein
VLFACPRPEFADPPALPWQLYVSGMAALGLCPMAHRLDGEGVCPVCPAPPAAVEPEPETEAA